jgi:hypothetical protein
MPSYLLSRLTDHRVHVDFPLMFSTSTEKNATSDEDEMDDRHYKAQGKGNWRMISSNNVIS